VNAIAGDEAVEAVFAVPAQQPVQVPAADATLSRRRGDRQLP